MRRHPAAAVALATAALAAAAIAAAPAAGAVAPPASTAPAVASAAWAARASAACRPWGQRLQQVPPPVALNPLVLGTMARRALPLLEGEARAIAAVPMPAALRERVQALLRANAGAVAALRGVAAAAARGDTAGAQQALARFLDAQAAVHALAQKAGLRC